MSPSQWLRDIAAHTRLLVQCHHIGEEQTEIMEQIRMAKASDTETVSVRMENDQLLITEGADVRDLDEELERLDHRLMFCRKQMLSLEGRILTHTPRDKEEVAVLLQFLGGILRMEHRLDREYLADLLDDFADVCMPVPELRPIDLH